MVHWQITIKLQKIQMIHDKHQIRKNSEIVDFFPHRFCTPITSSLDAEAIAASQLIHALENPTPSSQFKVEEPALAAIKKVSEIFKCAVQPP